MFDRVAIILCVQVEDLKGGDAKLNARILEDTFAGAKGAQGYPASMTHACNEEAHCRQYCIP